MLDLRMILWFIMGVSFLFWAFTFIFRITKLTKHWFIALGIWFTILIVQVSTKDIAMPHFQLLTPLNKDIYPTSVISLYEWIPSFITVWLPVSIWLLWNEHKRNKGNNIANNG